MASYRSGGGHDGTPDKTSRRPESARRAGYLPAAGFSAVLLFVLHGWPGWQAIQFLTGDTGQVLWLVSLSLAAGIAVNVVYLPATRRRSDGWATW